MNDTNDYTAVVIGATGLVGSHLLNLLLDDSSCKEIILIVRRKTNFKQTKITECIIDFTNFEDYLKHIKGDVLFSCLGTTLKEAGSKQKQYLVDYTYQYKAAESAAKNGVKSYILLSSPFAKLNSRNWYRKMKAELERDVKKLNFDRIAIIQPNGLIGKREKTRTGEQWILPFLLFLIKIFPILRKIKPIEAKIVAEVMIKAYYKIKLHTAKILIISRNELNHF